MLVITIALLAGCSGSTVPDIPENRATINPMARLASVPPPILELLQDIDVLIELMETEFPYLYSARYELGVDMIQALEDLQRHVYRFDALSVFHFYRYLQITFDQLGQAGNMTFHMPGRSNRYMTAAHMELYRYYRQAYGGVAKDLLAGHMTHDARMLQHDIRARGIYHGPHVADALEEVLHSGDMWALQAALARHPAPPPIHHHVLAPGFIAYLALLDMDLPGGSVAMVQQQMELLAGLIEFYYQVQDYDHLIIDIRGNTGGSTLTLIQQVLAPLWPNLPDATLDFYHVGHREMTMPSGLRCPHVFDHRLITPYARTISTHLFPIENLLVDAYLPDFNPASVQNLTHGYQVHFAPNMAPDPSFTTRGVNGFGGKVWLLVDELTSDTAHLFAYLAEVWGLATLVGHPTGGNYSGISTRYESSLPSSRIAFSYARSMLLDHRGRSMGLPVMPEVAVADGECALDVVLEMLTAS